MRAKFYFLLKYFIKNIQFFFRYGEWFPNYFLGKKVELKGKKNIFIDKKTLILDYTVLNTFPNPFSNPYRKKVPKGYINILENTRIKNNVQLYSYDGFIKIGKNCTINPFCVLYGNGGIEIGDNVLIATGTTIVASSHIFKNTVNEIRNQGITKRGIIIGNDVWIGANCTIVDGTIIQDGVIIGANSLVRGELCRNTVYAGTPIRKIKKRNES